MSWLIGFLCWLVFSLSWLAIELCLGGRDYEDESW
jgi:hypothetical protein